MTLNVGACFALLVALGYDPARLLDPKPLNDEGGGTPLPNNPAMLFDCESEEVSGTPSLALKGLWKGTGPRDPWNEVLLAP
jgi:hypothetical protein